MFNLVDLLLDLGVLYLNLVDLLFDLVVMQFDLPIGIGCPIWWQVCLICLLCRRRIWRPQAAVVICHVRMGSCRLRRLRGASGWALKLGEVAGGMAGRRRQSDGLPSASARARPARCPA
uniref:Uncharacterized protein n=1 Tax=Arundo donax TaxID=35708 RepID=A0A0A8XZL5_ARUDO